MASRVFRKSSKVSHERRFILTRLFFSRTLVSYSPTNVRHNTTVYILRDWLRRWVQCLLFIGTGRSASGHVSWHGKVHYAPFVRASMCQSRNQMRAARAYERWHLGELPCQPRKTISRFANSNSPRLDSVTPWLVRLYIYIVQNFMNVSFNCRVWNRTETKIAYKQPR